MSQKREARTWGDRNLARVSVYLASALSRLRPKIARAEKAIAVNPFASEYQAWRHLFLRNRLRIALWVGMSFMLTMVIYFLWAAIDDFAQQKPFKASFFWSSAAVASCLLLCYWLYKTPFGRRYPGAIIK